MGNESSTPVDESVPPQTLKSRNSKGLAEYIRSPKCKKIVIMSGAGISTSAGIPDFRSPDTGLYHNLARLNLPYAEAVFDISFFRKDPLPFYTLASELYPGRFRPTITHSFISLLHQKSLLLKHFTQNIDCLDREAGVPDSHIIEAHGSFARQSCIDCHNPYPSDLMRKAVATKTPPHCDSCSGLVKPEIVFFGEALPNEFFESRELPAEADLCIVMGTSLTVQPFASLPELVREHVPRVLINKEMVGGLGSRPDDVLLLGDCDEGARKLAEACGWLGELEGLWAKTKASAAEDRLVDVEKSTQRSNADSLDVDDEVERLTKEVDESLRISQRHEQETRAQLAREDPKLAGNTSYASKAEIGEEIQSHLRGSTENGDTNGPAEVGREAKPADEPTIIEAKKEESSTSGKEESALDHVFSHVKSNLS